MSIQDLRSKSLLFLLCMIYGSSNAQTLDLVFPLSGTGEDMATAVDADQDGNIYVAGSYSGSMTLGSGSASLALTSSGTMDGFIAKYDQLGGLIWAFGIGGSDYDEIFDVTVDDNAIHVTGYFKGTLDADPGPGTVWITSNGDKDILLAKYDLEGNLVWAHGIGGTGFPDQGAAIALDGAENIWISGSFRGTCDMDPGPGVFEIGGAQYNRTFLAKYSSEGQFIWAGSLGFHLVDFPERTSGLAVDGEDNVIITGRSQGIEDFDPGPGVHMLDNDSNRVSLFIAKYGPDGTLDWAHALPGWPNRKRSAVAVDAQGNVYTSASFNGEFDLDPGPGEDIRSSFFTSDLTYVMKLNSTGQYEWAVDFSPMIGTAVPMGMTLDPLGNIYMTGNFFGSLDFNPGSGSNTMFSANDDWGDGFILILDPTGDYIWAGKITSPEGRNAGMSIALDDQYDLLVSGSFGGSADLDPFSGIESYSSAGISDGFLVKIDMSLLTSADDGRSTSDGLLVYPVPARTELNVVETTGERYHAEVLDITGRCILETELEGPKAVIDVSAFPSGMYTLRTNKALVRFIVE